MVLLLYCVKRDGNRDNGTGAQMQSPHEYVTEAEDAASDGNPSYARELLGEAVRSFGEEEVFKWINDDTPKLKQLITLG